MTYVKQAWVDGVTPVDAAHMNHLEDGVEAAAAIPYGTTLPATPLDKQEAILVDSITNPNYQWRFRYNAGSTNAAKWEFIGGSILASAGGSLLLTPTMTAPAVIPAGPTLTVPRTGPYYCRFGAMLANNATYIGSYATLLQIYAGAGAVGSAQNYSHSAAWSGSPVSYSSYISLTAGQTLTLKAWLDRTGNQTQVSQCWLDIVPAKVQ